MPSPPNDTSPDAARLQAELYRRMTPDERLARAVALTAATTALALTGLRRRHPAADDRELLLRLAALRLGPALAAAAYGPLPDP